MKAPQKNPWELLRRYTNARIAPGRVGGSMPTKPILQFRVDHAMAKESVQQDWNAWNTKQALEEKGLSSLVVQSQADSKLLYLQRPDLGKSLDTKSVDLLNSSSGTNSDIGVVISEGLSAWAVERHVIPLLEKFLPLVSDLTSGPIILAKYGRVALGDEIGELLGCRLVIVCIGERPGLSSPDSLGIYITYRPTKGTTDERRNCISNIHSRGLSYEEAAQRLHYLCRGALDRKLTGVDLKDNYIGIRNDHSGLI